MLQEIEGLVHVQQQSQGLGWFGKVGMFILHRIVLLILFLPLVLILFLLLFVLTVFLLLVLILILLLEFTRHLTPWTRTTSSPINRYRKNYRLWKKRSSREILWKKS